MKEWGVADPAVSRGGVAAPSPSPPAREVHLLQRKARKPGAGLGKTTGWIHRTVLKRKGVELLGGVNYERIDDRGLTISFGEKRERARVLEVDHVVLCAGQEPHRDLEAPLRAAGVRVHLVGGADVAAELDAKRAIAQGTRVAAGI
jgi:2,4-dienoyl-CoA reductase (NADPH2)